MEEVRSHLWQGGAVFRKWAGIGKSAFYCDAFVSYCLAKTDNGELYCNGRREINCPHSMAWCIQNLAAIPIYLAMEGDVTFFDWEPNGLPNHVGFVEERIDADKYYTIEGNTSGGIVARKKRTDKQEQLTFRLHYTPTAFSADKPLEIDGIAGYSTIAVMQVWLNVEADAILGQGTMKALQKKLGVTADGLWGTMTTKALQKLIGVKQDGLWGPESVKALQRYLNSHVSFSTKVNKEVNIPAEAVAAPQANKKPQLPTLALKKSRQEVINDSITFLKWIAGDNSFHYGHGDDAHHNGCYFCETQPKSKKKAGIVDYKKTYCCNPLIGAAWAHGGCDQTALSLCRKGSSWGFKKTEGYSKSKKFKHYGKLKLSELEPGDVLCSDQHVAEYIGNGKVIHASGGDDNERNSKTWNNSIRIGTWTGYTRVHRYIGSVNVTNMLIRHGEVSYRVKQWQAFLNWYNGKKVVDEDGIFGDTTLKYTKAFQTAVKIAADGIVGAGTLAAAAKK